jgi:hypothetical protein
MHRRHLEQDVSFIISYLISTTSAKTKPIIQNVILALFPKFLVAATATAVATPEIDSQLGILEYPNLLGASILPEQTDMVLASPNEKRDKYHLYNCEDKFLCPLRQDKCQPRPILFVSSPYYY